MKKKIKSGAKAKRRLTKPTSLVKAKTVGSMGKGYGNWKTASGSKSWQYPYR